jgi:hypothetical protein
VLIWAKMIAKLILKLERIEIYSQSHLKLRRRPIPEDLYQETGV